MHKILVLKQRENTQLRLDKMKIVSKKEDPLLKRTVVTLEDDKKVTPSNKEFIEYIAKEMNCPAISSQE